MACVVATSLGVVGILGCGSGAAPGGHDLSQGTADLMTSSADLAGADLGGADLTMTTSPPDLIGVDVSCNPSVALSGGSLEGSWSYVGGCATSEAFKEISDNCAGSSVSNTAVAGPAGQPQPQGTLTLSGGSYTRKVSATVTGTATIVGSCASVGCANVQAAINSFTSGVTATCTGTGTCTCMLSRNVNTSDTGGYTVNGNMVTATPSSGSPQTYELGVSGSVLRYRGVTANEAGERGITYVLVK